ncbi:hypothetical protein HK096_000888, partial [Nowakowskiella sp. JEL0078]
LSEKENKQNAIENPLSDFSTLQEKIRTIQEHSSFLEYFENLFSALGTGIEKNSKEILSETHSTIENISEIKSDISSLSNLVKESQTLSSLTVTENNQNPESLNISIKELKNRMKELTEFNKENLKLSKEQLDLFNSSSKDLRGLLQRVLQSLSETKDTTENFLERSGKIANQSLNNMNEIDNKIESFGHKSQKINSEIFATVDIISSKLDHTRHEFQTSSHSTVEKIDILSKSMDQFFRKLENDIINRNGLAELQNNVYDFVKSLKEENLVVGNHVNYDENFLKIEKILEKISSRKKINYELCFYNDIFIGIKLKIAGIKSRYSDILLLLGKLADRTGGAGYKSSEAFLSLLNASKNSPEFNFLLLDSRVMRVTESSKELRVLFIGDMKKPSSSASNRSSHCSGDNVNLEVDSKGFLLIVRRRSSSLATSFPRPDISVI